MAFENIFNNTVYITSKFNLELFLTSLRAQLDSEVFRELILNEADGLKLTIKMEVVTDEYDPRKEAAQKLAAAVKAVLRSVDVKKDPIHSMKLLELAQLADSLS